MQDAVQLKYCVQPDINHVLEWSKILVGLFLDASRYMYSILTNSNANSHGVIAGHILVVGVPRSCRGYLRDWN